MERHSLSNSEIILRANKMMNFSVVPTSLSLHSTALLDSIHIQPWQKEALKVNSQSSFHCPWYRKGLKAPEGKLNRNKNKTQKSKQNKLIPISLISTKTNDNQEIAIKMLKQLPINIKIFLYSHKHNMKTHIHENTKIHRLLCSNLRARESRSLLKT